MIPLEPNQLSDCQGTLASLGFSTFDRQFERWWFATHESWLIRWGFQLQCFRWERCGKWQEMVGKLWKMAGKPC